MYLSPKRLGGALLLSAALVIGAGIAPAAAASSPFDGPIVTVKGHVTDPFGKPVAGIRVQSDCGCDFEGGQKPPTHLLGKDTTDKKGYYSYTVRKSVALNISFNDKRNVYLPATGKPKTTKTSAGYTINAKISKASILAGTVHDAEGLPTDGVDLRVYDAKTGKEVPTFDSFLDKSGHFHARIAAGTYKVKFRGNGFYYGSVWYGGAALKADAATVTVGYASKTAGIDGTVSIKPFIDGTVTVDGAKPLQFGSDKIIVELHDASGARLDQYSTSGHFSFVQNGPTQSPYPLPAGTYTLVFRPSTKGNAFFTPVTQTVVLAPNSAIRDQKVNLTTTPVAPGEKRAATITARQTSDGRPSVGKAYHATITVRSYASVKGGTVTLYAGGKKITTKTLPASGKVKVSTRFSGLSATADHNIRVAYSGTATTKASKNYVGQVWMR